MALTDFIAQKRIQEGDIKEFEALFKKYYEPLCRFANGIVGDIDAAEEIVQDFFYTYWKNRRTIFIQLSLNAYLYRAIKNNSLAYLRHQSICKRFADSVAAQPEASESISPQEELEVAEINQIVEDTLKQLPQRCSQVFQMSRFEGKKYQEIADILAISIKTVEADMGKALGLFRQKLKHYNRMAF